MVKYRSKEQEEVWNHWVVDYSTSRISKPSIFDYLTFGRPSRQTNWRISRNHLPSFTISMATNRSGNGKKSRKNCRSMGWLTNFGHQILEYVGWFSRTWFIQTLPNLHLGSTRNLGCKSWFSIHVEENPKNKYPPVIKHGNFSAPPFSEWFEFPRV